MRKNTRRAMLARFLAAACFICFALSGCAARTRDVTAAEVFAALAEMFPKENTIILSNEETCDAYDIQAEQVRDAAGRIPDTVYDADMLLVLRAVGTKEARAIARLCEENAGAVRVIGCYVLAVRDAKDAEILEAFAQLVQAP